MALEVRLTKPSMESSVTVQQTLNFEGEDDRGVDIVAGMELRLEEAGVHWFDVNLEGERVTRIPLRVVYLPRVVKGRG